MEETLIAEAMPPEAKTATLISSGKNYEISAETAIAWRRNWEADLAEANPENYVRSFQIDREELEAILSRPGMTSMRVYFGRAERGGQDKVIMVAVDRTGKDLVNGGAGPFYDFGSECPPFCGPGPSDNSWW